MASVDILCVSVWYKLLLANETKHLKGINTYIFLMEHFSTVLLLSSGLIDLPFIVYLYQRDFTYACYR